MGSAGGWWGLLLVAVAHSGDLVRLMCATSSRAYGRGLVNLDSGVPQNQHCRAHQAVRNRNHGDRCPPGDKLGLEAGWRSQHAADDDAAAYHRAWQIR